MIGDMNLFKKVLTGEIYDESFWQRVRSDNLLVANPIKRWLARSFLGYLERRGYQLVAPVVPTPSAIDRRHVGKDHPFVGFTMIGKRRLENLEQCVRAVINENVAGDVVECGVWRGGAAILAKYVVNEMQSDKLVWLCDSFEGLPPPTAEADAGYDFYGLQLLPRRRSGDREVEPGPFRAA